MFNCVTLSVNFEYLYFKKLLMIRNKVVWKKHNYFKGHGMTLVNIKPIQAYKNENHL